MKTLNKTPRSPKWKLALSKAGALLSIASWLCINPQSTQAQDVKHLGKVKEFRQALAQSSVANSKLRKSGKGINLATSESTLNTIINVHTIQNGTERFVGSVEGSPGSNVYFYFKDGKVKGEAFLLNEKKAYAYSTNALGEVEVKQQDIHDLVCVEYPQIQAPVNNNSISASLPPPSSAVFNLQSLPGAQNVMVLDFDGEYVVSDQWNGGLPIDALPTHYSEAEILEMWQLISEDFRPFNINITTSNAVFLAAPIASRTKCIFTPTRTAAPQFGGVAGRGSFYSGQDIPCWVFNEGVIPAGETGAHELAHTLGLSHDGRTNPQEDYYAGTAEWAPIMGLSYLSGVTHWSKGEYANADNTEDDIEIIANSTATTSPIGFRSDEAGNSETNAKLLVYNASGTIDTNQNKGIIAKRSDIDVYYFNSTGGTASIYVSATIPAHANLDVQLTLKNSSGTTIATANPANSLDASIVTVLPAGKYYIFIDGVGKGDPAGTGYSHYGSLGSYKITGNIIADTPPSVSLSLYSSVVDHYGTLYVKAPGPIDLHSSPNDVEGPIAKVEFYRDDVKIGEDAFYPGHNWYISNTAQGTYTFKAKAFDKAGLSTWSNPITVIVDGTAPTVSITAPTNNASFTAPASFEFTTSPLDGQGPVKKVEFYQNETLIGYDDGYPSFSMRVSNLPAGTYAFKAKVFDVAGNSSFSTPITVTVAPPCLVDEVLPVATQFVVRNVWNDQNSGSGVSNESGALKVVQRAYGNSDLWVLETGKTFSVTNGQIYNIKLDFQDFAAKTVTGVEVGFANSVNAAGTAPNLVGSTVSFPAGYSSAAFTTKSVNLTASATGTVFLAIKLKWSSQPSVQIVDYIKNLKICPSAGIPARSELSNEESTISGISINPNPSASLFHMNVLKDIALLHIADLQGRYVYTQGDILKDATLSLGQELPMGMYIVNVQYGDGSHESLKIVKAN